MAKTTVPLVMRDQCKFQHNGTPAKEVVKAYQAVLAPLFGQHPHPFYTVFADEGECHLCIDVPHMKKAREALEKAFNKA